MATVDQRPQLVRANSLVNPSASKWPEPLARFCASSWPILLVFALAGLLRAWQLTEWSMWEDEEGTVYFSQRPEKSFPQFFPIFFVALRWVYLVTGVSVAVGRVFSAAFGLLSIVLVYWCFRAYISRRVATLAALLLAVNLGHLFWSQSIRYYNLVVVFQLLSMYCFLTGFERGNYGLLALSHVALILGLWTHFSAVLLAPAYFAYLTLMAIRHQTGGAYNWRGYCIYGSSLAAIVGIFAWKLHDAQSMLGSLGSGLPSARDPVHVLVTAVAYFGPPLVALAIFSPFLAPLELPGRILWFFVAVTLLPVLELLVIAQMNTVNVTWYYALVALSGCAVLASLTLIGLYERGFRRSVFLAGLGCAAYCVFLLAGYYTTMFGDRPRWEEATLYLRQTGDIHVGASHNPEIFASVPGVVAFYLGVDPGETKTDPLVQMVPMSLPSAAPLHEQWYVVETGHISFEYQSWLDSRCRIMATFVARTGPRDRTVRVYHFIPPNTAARH
jgi:hypothetical protein